MLRPPQRCLVELDLDDSRDAIKVGVMGQERRAHPPCNGRDHAIEHSAWGDTRDAAAAIDPNGAVEVDHWIEAKQLKAGQ